MPKIIKLANRNRYGRGLSVVDMLENAIEDLKENPKENNFNKAIVLFLNDEGGGYTMSFSQANMDRCDIITLLEAMKSTFIKPLAGEAKEGW